MSDRLRQTLVGLQEVAPWQHGVQYAAVTMVGAATYRKLARKTSVSYPLLSDPSRAWLGLLGAGAPAAGEVVLYVVAVPTATVLAQFADEGGVPQLLEAVAAAVGRGRAALEAEAATCVQEASKAAQVRWPAWRGSCPGALALCPALLAAARPSSPRPYAVQRVRAARAGGSAAGRERAAQAGAGGDGGHAYCRGEGGEPVLRRTSRGLRAVRAGYAYQPRACCTCQGLRAACPHALYVQGARTSLGRAVRTAYHVVHHRWRRGRRSAGAPRRRWRQSTRGRRRGRRRKRGKGRRRSASASGGAWRRRKRGARQRRRGLRSEGRCGGAVGVRLTGRHGRRRRVSASGGAWRRRARG